jgi:hypothetical protein
VVFQAEMSVISPSPSKRNRLNIHVTLGIRTTKWGVLGLLQVEGVLCKYVTLLSNIATRGAALGTETTDMD